ncbi:nitroreductase [Oceanicoccus sp. KOV_DT_Chl]|uniref:nitroreductase n=1 Tax=Oceanicoccus sp. KOV_DT_Chl TaxID=1904639 RepID=UPI000C7DDD1F|nr:nitroreductase [Oceanicoccus sp. KOV_DT_Chl]
MSETAVQIFTQIVESRRSTRGFKQDAVPQDLLDKVFSLAQHAPSNCNTQPWQVYVLSGEARDKASQTLTDSIASGDFSMDFDYQGKYEGVYKERQYDAAMQLYSAMGIAREDKARRNDAFIQNFNFFGAPHVAFLFLPEPFGIREAADLGMYAQNLMLSMTAHGLASCPQTALSFNADAIREIAGVAPENKLLFGISFGYEDIGHAANKCRVGRADLDTVVHFVQ